jgi:predicted AlkP superfamily phosphohydrolase/phosphomutase
VAESRQRVCVIGLDGATFDVMRPLMDQGALPHLEEIERRGVSGELRSTIPPQSSVAWPSFFTGVGPGKHGVFSFWERTPGSLERPIISSRSIRAATVWDVMRDHGRKVISVNVPVTYPPPPVDGVLISGLLTPSEEVVFTHPPELIDGIRREVGDYKIDYELLGLVHDEEVLLRRLMDTARLRTETMLYLMNHYPWDLAMIVFTLTDRVQHFFWDRMVLEGDGCDPLSTAIQDCYRVADEAIGEVLESVGPEVPVVILSDHGFGPKDKNVYLNRWLWERGWLRFTEPVWLRSRRLRWAMPTVARLAERMGLGSVDRLLPRPVRDLRIPVPTVKRVDLHLLIDWSRTTAYTNWMGSEEGIYLNVVGREPRGIVQPGRHYEEVQSAIARDLLAWTEPDTGLQVVDRVYRREELYHGPYLDEAPDLILTMQEHRYMPSGRLDAHRIFEPTSDERFSGTQEGESGTHRENGIFMARGPAIRRGERVEGARIIDVMPTCLYLMGLPIRSDMDGVVIEGAVDADYRAHHAIEVEEAREYRPTDHGPAYTEEEAGLTRERLRGLGYLE